MLQLDVCILEAHNSRNKMGRLNIWFPIVAEQAKIEEGVKLRKLEFENLEDPEPEEFMEYGETVTKNPQNTNTPNTNTQSTNTQNTETQSTKTQRKVGFDLQTAETHAPYVESLAAPSISEKIIECFCSSIQEITETQTSVGVLVYNGSKHQVWVPRASLTRARMLSLAELLSLPEPPPMVERLKLAVRLASSVLQFHTSGWLRERWGKQDIYFIQRDSPQSQTPSLDTPVVPQSFTQEPSPPETTIKPHLVDGNLSLFSLGIVLIELWFWKSVESFQADKPEVDDLDITRYMTAMGLIKTIQEKAGAQFGGSVWHCICGIDHQETRLEDNGFKNEAYLKVLQPLVKHLEFSCDKPLSRIFQKQGVC